MKTNTPTIEATADVGSRVADQLDHLMPRWLEEYDVPGVAVAAMPASRKCS